MAHSDSNDSYDSGSELDLLAAVPAGPLVLGRMANYPRVASASVLHIGMSVQNRSVDVVVSFWFDTYPESGNAVHLEQYTTIFLKNNTAESMWLPFALAFQPSGWCC